MYLHIGNGDSIKIDDIIGIFDLDTATVSKITKKFISKKEKEKKVEYTDFDLPRSFILVKDSGVDKVKRSAGGIGRDLPVVEQQLCRHDFAVNQIFRTAEADHVEDLFHHINVRLSDTKNPCPAATADTDFQSDINAGQRASTMVCSLKKKLNAL